MKISELTDELLAYWAARALGAKPDDSAKQNEELCGLPLATNSGQGDFFLLMLERRRISVIPADFEGKLPDAWVSFAPSKNADKEVCGKGPTALIAGMRACVASEFGDEVPDIAPSEKYAGIILGEDGAPNYHLILLDGEAQNVNWERALGWARKKMGGVLPTRREQSLLFANLKEQFQDDWYWSSEQDEQYVSHAWVQYFCDGSQFPNRKGNRFKARAVRRVYIEQPPSRCKHQFPGKSKADVSGDEAPKTD